MRVTYRGWSNESIEAARANARDRAQRIAQRLDSVDTPSRQYLYGERPLPEPVLRELSSDDGGQTAVVTRNAYGSLVLNTRDLMFVDIDREDKQIGAIASGFRSLFGKSAPVQTVLMDIQRVAENNNLGARVYKTAAGYRVLITNAAFRPGDHRAEDLLGQFDADPLYIRLCRMQESFRARLSPKPWRCGVQLPPVTFPFETPEHESRFQNWERKYSTAAEGYATCQFVGNFGSSSMPPGFEELVDYHDRETRAGSGLRLA